MKATQSECSSRKRYHRLEIVLELAGTKRIGLPFQSFPCQLQAMPSGSRSFDQAAKFSRPHCFCFWTTWLDTPSRLAKADCVRGAWGNVTVFAAVLGELLSNLLSDGTASTGALLSTAIGASPEYCTAFLRDL